MSFKLLPSLLILLCWFHQTTAQYLTIKGKITDEDTKEALAFVNISYNNGRYGITSNIDGLFKIETIEPLIQLTFSYVGYNTKTIVLLPDDYGKDLQVKLTKNEIELAEVTVKPAENPAHRIIKKVLENRNRNNPQKMRSFGYTSYNKMYFTLQQDTSLQRKHPLVPWDSLGHDTSFIHLNKIMNHQPFLLMEFVSKRLFKYPDKSNEEIISSRVSGFSDPSFTLLATQMQSFGFYDNMVRLLGKKYLNPISPGSTKKYFFLLENTFMTETNDTLFVISFRPKRSSRFEGLQGVLYINSNGYAIQNVIAEPNQNAKHFAIRIQQRYELMEHKQWFPTQLNTDLLFKGTKIRTKRGEYYPVGIGKSYLSEINLNPDLSNVKFSNIEVKVAENAHQQADSTWLNYRQLPLTAKDSATYKIIDSIGKVEKYDQKLRFFESLTSGYIPYKIFDIDYRKFFSYNRFEGIRLGMGLTSNQKLAPFFSLGGYFAYGVRDDDWKFGSFLQLFRNWTSETKLTFKYSRDVWETARYTFLEDKMMSSTEWYRDFMINQMDLIEEKEMSLCFRMFQYFKCNLYLNQSKKYISNYGFGTNGVSANNFNFTEAGINLKFGFKEKFILTPSKRRLSLGTNYPMLWFNLMKGFNILNGEFQYTKYELKLTQRFTNRKMGRSQITFVTGKVDGNIPISNLYNGRGSYQPFNLETENSFASMRFNEFYSSEFASLFLKQNFGSLLFSTPKFKPEVCLITNISYGKLLHREYHQLAALKTLEKGYYESGILINKLLNEPLTGIGFGVFYRYGPNRFPNITDNFAYKITLVLNL